MFSAGLFQLLIWPAATDVGFAFLPAPAANPHPELEKAIEALADAIRKGERIAKIPYLEQGFPSSEVTDEIPITGEQTTTEVTITPVLPESAMLKKASVLTSVTALNNSATAQKIDITVQARKGAGGFSDYFSQDSIIGFGAVDGAVSSILPISTVTALIDDLTATYGFRCSINQTSANSVIYTIQHVLVINYALS